MPVGSSTALTWAARELYALTLVINGEKLDLAMFPEKIADYRYKVDQCLARAEASLARADAASDTETKSNWLAMAKDWQFLADRVEQDDPTSVTKLAGDSTA